MAVSSSPPATSPARRPRRRTAVGLVLMLLGAVLALVGPGSSVAGAVTHDGMTAIDGTTTPSLTTYPGSLFPAGCTVTDGQVLTGTQYSASGPVNAGPVSDMRDLPLLPAGTTLTMTWTGWKDGCSTPISLAVKRAVGPVFDETTDQALLAFEGCAPEAAGDIPACDFDGETYRLSLLMPNQLAGCSYQTDAVVGPPLTVVGPDGSFYGSGLRASNGKGEGPSMLISADNEGPADPTGSGCQDPTVVVTCGEGGAVVTITNPDVFDDIRVTVTADDEVVATDVEVLKNGGTASVTVPLGLDEHPAIQVTDAQRNLYGPTVFEENCATPSADATLDCQEDTITIETSSTGPQAVTFTATINGTEVALDADGSTTVPTAGFTAPFTVEVSANGEVIHTSDPLDCDSPQADVTVDCAEGEITVTVTQPEDHTVEFVVTADGIEVEANEDGTYTVASGIHSVDIVVTADGDELLTETVEPCEEPTVAACVAGKSLVEAFTIGDVLQHAAGEFAVTIDLATGTWSSTKPVDYIMVIEDNDTIRTFSLPGNFTSGLFDVTTVTVTVNGQPVVVQGTVTDAQGNPAAVEDISAITFCDGVEVLPTTTTTQPPTEVLGVQQSRQLPRTGADDAGRMALAVGFIVFGFGLVLFGEDRRLGVLLQRR